MTDPPSPPSPPSGPPLGTNFSRRNATAPSPPFPAFTRMTASSTNMGSQSGTKAIKKRHEGVEWSVRHFVPSCLLPSCLADSGPYVDFAALELDLAVDQREEG